ncbi:MAG: DUF4012 domain-containing protein [Candidatus Promineofilum sp.]|nr:DUF4012 domain-containing protein [Promineifilum sp.]
MTSEKRYPPIPSTAPPVPSEASPTPSKSRASGDRIARLLIVAGILIILLWLGLKAWRVYQATHSLLNIEPEARALLAGGMNQIDPDAAEALMLRARQDITILHTELAVMRPIAPALGWVPRYGPVLVAAPFLLDMADAGSEAGAVAVTSLKPALAIVQSETFGAARLGELLPILNSAAPQMEQAAEALGRYDAARRQLAATVEQEALPWRVRQLLDLSDEWLPAAEDGLRLLPQLPAMLGQDGPKRYLILAQNEDEMRATGGFITGAGVLTLSNGRITALDFRDANNVDNWREKPYAFPPQPFYDFMRLELFGFRDANFWPEFPVSAQKAMDLYAYGQNVPPLEGAIAIDQEFLRLLVDATGPVPIPGTDQRISADNLLQTLRQARDIQEGQNVQEWVRDRKAFLGGFAAAIQAKIETDFSAVDPLKLAANLVQAAEERHLSIYMRDPELGAILAANGWDGSLPQAPPGDFLMAVDTNMGYNKANLFVERELAYDVLIGPQPQGRLTLTYRHTGPASDKPCYQGVDQEFEEAAEYLAIADQCYWNYLRIYAPAGSALIDSSPHLVPAETLYSETAWNSRAQTIEDIPWLAVFANFMLVPRGQTVTSFFSYELPAGVVAVQDGGERLYHLSVQKQPGMKSEQLTVTITLPQDAVFLEAIPAPTTVEGAKLVFTMEFDSDRQVIVRYR